jgi:hypothetical protein
MLSSFSPLPQPQRLLPLVLKVPLPPLALLHSFLAPQNLVSFLGVVLQLLMQMSSPPLALLQVLLEATEMSLPHLRLALPLVLQTLQLQPRHQMPKVHCPYLALLHPLMLHHLNSSLDLPLQLPPLLVGPLMLKVLFSSSTSMDHLSLPLVYSARTQDTPAGRAPHSLNLALYFLLELQMSAAGSGQSASLNTKIASVSAL